MCSLQAETIRIRDYWIYPLGTRLGAVVRALAFHQCGPGSISGLGVICGLSLLIFYPVLRGFLLGPPAFPSPQKLTLDLIWFDLYISGRRASLWRLLIKPPRHLLIVPGCDNYTIIVLLLFIMKVNDLEESEWRVYAHLHKLLSKSEMNDICMRLYDIWRSVQKKCFTIWEMNIQQNKTWKSCRIKTSCFCYHLFLFEKRIMMSSILFFSFFLFFFHRYHSVMTLLAI